MQDFSQAKHKILCHINHFYGVNPLFTGKSTTQEAEVRKKIIEKCISSLKKLGKVEIKICGIEPFALLDLDLKFQHLTEDPTQIVYESIYKLAEKIDEYDYFICIEDDILLPEQTFQNIIEFDSQSLLNEVLHPNRLETDEN